MISTCRACLNIRMLTSMIEANRDIIPGIACMWIAYAQLRHLSFFHFNDITFYLDVESVRQVLDGRHLPCGRTLVFVL